MITKRYPRLIIGEVEEMTRPDGIDPAYIVDFSVQSLDDAGEILRVKIRVYGQGMTKPEALNEALAELSRRASLLADEAIRQME